MEGSHWSSSTKYLCQETSEGNFNTDDAMDCPFCKNAMITLELADVEIDHCIECGGIWLDAGELEMLLADTEAAKKLVESFEIEPNCAEKPRPCPICDKKMQKVLVGKSPPVLLIDRCIKGHGLWFDKGELQNIIDKAELDKENKIQRILADMFSKKKNGSQA